MMLGTVLMVVSAAALPGATGLVAPSLIPVATLLPTRHRTVRTMSSADSNEFLEEPNQKVTNQSSSRHRTVRTMSPLDSNEFLEEPDRKVTNNSSSVDWVSLGMSGIYLAHFASLYTQLPGLSGPSGVLPIADRISSLTNDVWALQLMPSPELGMEVFTLLGIAISAAQIVFRKARHGLLGVVSFGLEWILWHDLVVSGGRFMAYQMDLLLLDAAPLTVLAASGLSPSAAVYGYRWLLSRLYIGAGAVKLLSCDTSWRNLSAVHWHFQSQPLPNPLGAAAYLGVPDEIGKAVTLAVLVMEMALPFLFLVSSREIRRVAFCLNMVLMVGIALFGNFGPLQALLIVISFALLDDLPAGEELNGEMEQQRSEPKDATSVPTVPGTEKEVSSAITVVSVCLAAWATLWTVHDVGARCLDTWTVEPLVYCLTVVGAAVACLPLFQSTADGVIAGLVSLVIFAGSAPTMANGLGVFFPFVNALEFLNLGASPYGLFATITGVNGRPVAVIEAAQSVDGPWHYVPLLYQVNDPKAPLPLCFPHFPRLDWTLWFIPFGEQGLWIARFFDGITNNDPAVMGLVNESAFRLTFPNDPPSIVRVVPRKYTLDPSTRGWLVSEDERYSQSPVLATFTRGDLAGLEGVKQDAQPWPSVPPLRSLSLAVGRPEHFVWGCLGTAEAARRVVETSAHDDSDKPLR